MRGAVAVIGLAGICVGLASPCAGATYSGMTQDLLLRQSPSPFWFLRLIWLAGAMSLSLWLLAGLKRSFDAGRPVRVVGVAVRGSAVAILWMLVWSLGGVPVFGPLSAPEWLVD